MVAIILLIIYLKGPLLLSNAKTLLHNCLFIINRNTFDYSPFEENDGEVDFSKMVFEQADSPEEM